jgi:hypothetical protein
MGSFNRTALIAADQSMIDGIQKFLSENASLLVGSQKMTPSGLVSVFQDRIDATKAAIAAAAAHTAAVKVVRDKRAASAALVQSLRRLLQGMYTQSPDTLAAFGLTAPKVAKKSVATKSTALAKTKATRAARKTMGSQQRKGVKGAATTANTGSAQLPLKPLA